MKRGIADARASGLAIGDTASGHEMGSLRRVAVLVEAVRDGIAVGSRSGDGEGWWRGSLDALESAGGSMDVAQRHLHCWIDWFVRSLQWIHGSIATLTSFSKAKVFIVSLPSPRRCRHSVTWLAEY
jgi:hypothetical protein